MFNLFKLSNAPDPPPISESGTQDCAGCRKAQIPQQLATCPTCKGCYCPGCGRIDHILVYETGTPAIQILSVVVRCLRDGALLQKFGPGPDPYISHLRELEQSTWDARSVDPKGELGQTVTWTDVNVALARRYLAVGMTFHSSPVVSFGVLGGLHRFLTGHDGNAYLQQCAKDFGTRGFELNAARRLVMELGAAMKVSTSDHREHTQALLIARQFLRTRSMA